MGLDIQRWLSVRGRLAELAPAPGLSQLPHTDGVSPLGYPLQESPGLLDVKESLARIPMQQSSKTATFIAAMKKMESVMTCEITTLWSTIAASLLQSKWQSQATEDNILTSCDVNGNSVGGFPHATVERYHKQETSWIATTFRMIRNHDKKQTGQEKDSIKKAMLTTFQSVFQRLELINKTVAQAHFIKIESQHCIPADSTSGGYKDALVSKEKIIKNVSERLHFGATHCKICITALDNKHEDVCNRMITCAEYYWRAIDISRNVAWKHANHWRHVHPSVLLQTWAMWAANEAAASIIYNPLAHPPGSNLEKILVFPPAILSYAPGVTPESVTSFAYSIVKLLEAQDKVNTAYSITPTTQGEFSISTNQIRVPLPTSKITTPLITYMFFIKPLKTVSSDQRIFSHDDTGDSCSSTEGAGMGTGSGTRRTSSRAKKGPSPPTEAEAFQKLIAEAEMQASGDAETLVEEPEEDNPRAGNDTAGAEEDQREHQQAPPQQKKAGGTKSPTPKQDNSVDMITSAMLDMKQAFMQRMDQQADTMKHIQTNLTDLQQDVHRLDQDHEAMRKKMQEDLRKQTHSSSPSKGGYASPHVLGTEASRVIDAVCDYHNQHLAHITKDPSLLELNAEEIQAANRAIRVKNEWQAPEMSRQVHSLMMFATCITAYFMRFDSILPRYQQAYLDSVFDHFIASASIEAIATRHADEQGVRDTDEHSLILRSLTDCVNALYIVCRKALQGARQAHTSPSTRRGFTEKSPSLSSRGRISDKPDLDISLNNTLRQRRDLSSLRSDIITRFYKEGRWPRPGDS